MALVGEALLSASIQVLCDRIASCDFIDLFRRKKLDDSLLMKLKMTLLVLSVVLNDAEEKQIVKPAVREWLDELKHAVLDAEDLVDEINTEALTCKVEAEYAQTHKFTKVWNFLSTFNPSCHSMTTKISGLLERLELLAYQKTVQYFRVIGYGSSLIFQPFQSLEKLEFEEMLEWEEWQPSGGEYPDFPRLQELILNKCPKLRGNLPNHLPCLKKLSVEKCVVLYERATTTLNMDYLQQCSFEELSLVGCPHLLSLLGQRTKYMSSLGNLNIRNFVDIECLPKQLVHSSNCLQYLRLYDCPSLLSFPRDGLPTTLVHLHIENCRRLEFLPHEMMAKLTSLLMLSIHDSCDSLRSFPLGIFPKLSHLSITGCVNLESLSIEGVDENLNYLGISECPNLVSFPHGGLPTPNLIFFSVDECENLKSLPERIHTLTALQYLSIWNLPNIVSIEEGGLPPNLREFHIRGCDNLLETLLKEQLLPTTLNTLRISELSLKSLNGKGLQHLTSLQSLEIHDCPSLESLPGEGLPASLSFLGISRCSSTLKKRYCENKTGEDWGKIARIPCIKIDEEVII